MGVGPGRLASRLKLFLSILRANDFSTTSQHRPLAPSTITQHVSDLRDTINDRLFLHDARTIHTAPTNLTFTRHTQQVITRLHLTQTRTMSLDDTPRKLVQISTPTTFKHQRLTPIVTSFLVLCPNLSIRLRLVSDFISVRNLGLNGISLILHTKRLTSAQLITAPLTGVIHVTYTDPSCLGHHNIPASPIRLVRRSNLS